MRVKTAPMRKAVSLQQKRDKGMLPVKVDQLFLSNLGFVVLLKNSGDERSLPIFIGAAEAQAIAIQINNVKMPRPLTHDLIKNVLDFMECRLQRIEVCDLREGTFYARLVLDRDGEEMTLDSRPSDAIALALRCSAPIFVAETVMDEAGKVLETEQEAGGAPSAEPGTSEGDQKPEQELSPLEALERRLQAAVKAERYEEAARLRDEIKHLRHSHPDN